MVIDIYINRTVNRHLKFKVPIYYYVYYNTKFTKFVSRNM